VTRVVSFTFYEQGEIREMHIKSRVRSSPDASWRGHTTSTSGIGPHNCGTSTSCTNPPTPHRVHSRSFEHRRVLQHIRDDEKSDHTASDVDLVQLRYAAIAARDGDVPQGDVEVILSFSELPSVELTGFELYCDDVAEGFVKELYWDS